MEKTQSKTIITVVGKDTVGIIAKVCTYLSEQHINVYKPPLFFYTYIIIQFCLSTTYNNRFFYTHPLFMYNDSILICLFTIFANNN